jgi:hypothetical protein
MRTQADRADLKKLVQNAKYTGEVLRHFFFTGRVKPNWQSLAAHLHKIGREDAEKEARAAGWMHISRKPIDERAWVAVLAAFREFKWVCTSCTLFSNPSGSGPEPLTAVAPVGVGEGGAAESIPVAPIATFIEAAVS